VICKPELDTRTRSKCQTFRMPPRGAEKNI
jgi:hypothetical protein